jgi:hypothetical protein
MSTLVDPAVVERHAVALPDGLIERSLRQVLEAGQRAAGFAAGRIEHEHDLPPAALELDLILRKEIVDPVGQRRGVSRFQLGFLKAGDGDAPPEQTFSPSAMRWAPRVFRVLVNLSEYPRRALLWTGSEAPDEVVVPGRRCGAVHSLQYWVDAVPHCGVNDALGYFVAAYEAPPRR